MSNEEKDIRILFGINVKLSSFLSGIIIYSIGINFIMLIKVNFKIMISYS